VPHHFILGIPPKIPRVRRTKELALHSENVLRAFKLLRCFFYITYFLLEEYYITLLHTIAVDVWSSCFPTTLEHSNITHN